MILQHLKASTKTQHERVENLMNLLDPKLSKRDYSDVLVRFHCLYAELEPLIFERPEWFGLPLHIGARRKLGLLEQDLESLQLRPLPKPQNELRFPTFAHALGALYVVEGATLGGQVIGRHLEQRLGFTARHGAAFFNSYGDQVGANWREFCAFLTAQAATLNPEADITQGITQNIAQDITQDITKGAVLTFMAFEQHLNAGRVTA